ncbi:MAG: BACON domain-containing protein [Tidjanibacter sp.]|nr:BACON domain-containing protein [Tidjanibacter sp.]
MKKYLNKISLLAVTLLAIACTPKEEADKISISAFEYTFSADGGNLSLTLSANKPWSVKTTKGSEWIRVNKTMGNEATDVEIIVTALANDSDAARSGEVTFTAGTASEVLTLNQVAPDAPAPAYITIEKKSFDIAVEGGELEIPFSTNYPWSGEVIEGSDWLSFVTPSGEFGDAIATIKAALNHTPATRTGKIRLSAAEAKAEITITQEGLVNSYAINGVVKKFGSIGAARVGDNYCIVASLTQGYESYDEIAENDIDFFTGIVPLLNGKEFDIMGDGENYTIISNLDGAYLETVARELTDEVKSGKVCLTVADGRATLAESIVLKDGTTLAVGIDIEANIASNENIITRGDEEKPLRTLFYNNDEDDYLGLYLTPAGVDYFSELEIVTWYLYLLADRSLFADGSFDLSDVSADKIFYFGMVDNQDAENSFDIDMENMGGASGNVTIEDKGNGDYFVNFSIVHDGTLYTANYEGTGIDYATEPPAKDTNYIKSGNQKYTLDSQAVLTKGESVWSVEFEVVDNGKSVVITAPKGCFDGNARGFSQSADLTVTYDGTTFSKAQGYSGTITLALDEEEGSLSAEFTNYAGFELSFDGKVTIE